MPEEYDTPVDGTRGSEMVKLGRSVYERTNPNYVDRVDKRNAEIYFGLDAIRRAQFLEGLPLEEKWALREKIRWVEFVAASEITEQDTSAVVLVQAVVEPYQAHSEGSLVRILEAPWRMIVSHLKTDWSLAFKISPRMWEEMIAAAFTKAGFDDVILTPRSGDHGRDVIAVRKGIGSIRIIDSVKAYKASHLVKHDDVRALAGVLLGDQQASKGIITTTSDFAPEITKDPFLAPLMPYRLELMNGKALRDWLQGLAE
jgi:restriction system protein